MKPTQEQIMAWAKQYGVTKKDAKYVGIRVENLINAVYEAGRKDGLAVGEFKLECVCEAIRARIKQ